MNRTETENAELNEISAATENSGAQNVTAGARPSDNGADTPDPVDQALSGKHGRFVSSLILFFKGLIVGVANIIPGVSGGTVAVITGVFDPIIEALNTLFKKFVRNLKFIIPLGLGAVAGVVAFSKLVGYSLDRFPLQTGFFFVGLVLGSVPMIYASMTRSGRFKGTYLIPFALCALAVVALAVTHTYFVPEETAAGTLPQLTFTVMIRYFFGGMLSAGAMVVPGVSGSLVMMLLGLYDDMLAMISGITSFGDKALMLRAFLCIIPMALGIIAGIFTIARIIGWLFKKFRTGTYYGILGLLAGSVLALLISLRMTAMVFTVPGVLVSAATLAAGIALSYFTSKL